MSYGVFFWAPSPRHPEGEKGYVPTEDEARDGGHVDGLLPRWGTQSSGIPVGLTSE